MTRIMGLFGNPPWLSLILDGNRIATMATGSGAIAVGTGIHPTPGVGLHFTMVVGAAPRGMAGAGYPIPVGDRLGSPGVPATPIVVGHRCLRIVPGVRLLDSRTTVGRSMSALALDLATIRMSMSAGAISAIVVPGIIALPEQRWSRCIPIPE